MARVARVTPIDGAVDLDRLRKTISKELGQEVFFGSNEKLALRKLPLGISVFDSALDGGFAFDRMVLIIGEFSAGKTTLAWLAIKAGLANGLTAAYVDIERGWNPEWARALGIDPSKILVVQPKTGEQAGDAIIALLRAKIDIIVVDSLAAVVPSVELEADQSEMFEKQFIGGTPRLINRIVRTITAENQGSLVICINQLREGIGVTFGNPESLPGGKGQKFHAWQIVRVRRGAWLEEGTGSEKRRVGYRMRIRVEKNKQGAPFKEAEVPFYFTGEVDELAGLVEFAIEAGAVHVDKAWYYVGFDPTTGSFKDKYFGRRAFLEAVRTDPDLQQYLRSATDHIEEVDI
jgi:recombination protein RecA